MSNTGFFFSGCLEINRFFLGAIIMIIPQQYACIFNLIILVVVLGVGGTVVISIYLTLLERGPEL